MIEVWRPGRPTGARRRQPRDQERKSKPEPAPAPQVPVVEKREPRANGRPDRQRRSFRPERPRGKPREERPRERPIDPNSPFAALAELKARLEAEGKNKG